jgi:hypothetical protein
MGCSPQSQLSGRRVHPARVESSLSMGPMLPRVGNSPCAINPPQPGLVAGGDVAERIIVAPPVSGATGRRIMPAPWRLPYLHRPPHRQRPTSSGCAGPRQSRTRGLVDTGSCRLWMLSLRKRVRCAPCRRSTHSANHYPRGGRTNQCGTSGSAAVSSTSISWPGNPSCATPSSVLAVLKALPMADLLRLCHATPRTSTSALTT